MNYSLVLQGFDHLLYASGGASRWPTLSDSFARSQSGQAGQRKVTLTPLASGYQIDEEVFDQVIFATGAWLGTPVRTFRL